MKYIFLIFYLMILLFILGCEMESKPTEPNLEGYDFGVMKVITVDILGQKVDSAKVFLNGVFKGYTHITIDSIPFGIHTLRVQKIGYEIYSENIVVENDLIINKAITLHKLPLNTGQLLVTVDQDSAQTTITDISNEIVEQTLSRELSLTLEAGGYFIRCEKRGYKLVSIAVEIKIDSITIVNIILDKIINPVLPQIVLIIPETGRVNEPVLISWESTNASRVDIDFIENPGLNGKREVIFNSIGKYYIKAFAYNQFGQESVIDSIFIKEIPKISPTIELQVLPRIVYIGDIATISWNTTNATKVEVDYVPNPGLSGQWQVQFFQIDTIFINAHVWGPGGEARDSDTLFVIEGQPPSLEFSVSPDTVEFSEPVLLNWNSDGYQVIIDQGVGKRGPVGSEEIMFTNPGKKVITATAYSQNNLTTAKRDSVFVKEPPVPPLPVLSLLVVDSVEVNQPALIEWHSWYATSVDVDYVQNPGLNGKAEVIFQTHGEKIISATAYNDIGQVTVSDTLIVANNQITSVQPILIPSDTVVCAIHPTIPQICENAGEATIKVSGNYRLTAVVWYDSGDYQKNESFFITIISENGFEHTPMDPNAGSYKIVPDKQGPPDVIERDAGLFNLEDGKINIKLYHYYTIADHYPQFIVDGSITGAESVRIIYFKMEYIE